jgi:hypothetical protein
MAAVAAPIPLLPPVSSTVLTESLILEWFDFANIVIFYKMDFPGFFLYLKNYASDGLYLTEEFFPTRTFRRPPPG